MEDSNVAVLEKENISSVAVEEEFKVKGGKIYAFFKRTFDIVSSFLALVVLFVPILILLLIKFLEDGHNPIYTSTRVGQYGREFKFYKIRSMCIDAEARLEELREQNEIEGGVIFKMKNDPRVTKFGKFIRKTSLDELPQLVNILKGDMSVIGPRCALPSEVEKYDSKAMKRLLVPQGLSGEWQANGRSDTTYDEMIDMDLDYIKNKRSFFYDIKLIFKTAGMVICGRGAE